MNKNVLIVIVNWNGFEVLRKCIESINSINYENYRVLVVDNNSKVELLSSYNEYNNIDIIKLDANYGFGSAIFVYITVNMAMVLGLVPIVGSPLPIMSYGGSSMLATMIGFGIVMSTKIYAKQMIS